jgi:biopolymer transport protein ExbD
MRPLAILAVSLLVAGPMTASCSAPPSGLTIQVTNPQAPVYCISGTQGPLTPAELSAAIKNFGKTAADKALSCVIVEVDPKAPYECTTLVMRACNEAQIPEITLDGRRVRVDWGPEPPPRAIVDPGPHVAVQLIDEGADGQGCRIIVEAEELGSDIAALHSTLVRWREAGLNTALPVHLEPTARCRQEWVMKAYDAVAEAGFSNIWMTTFEDAHPPLKLEKKRKAAPSKTAPAAESSQAEDLPPPTSDVAAGSDVIRLGGTDYKIRTWEYLGSGPRFYHSDPDESEVPYE